MNKSAGEMTIEEMVLAAKAKNKAKGDLSIDEMVALAKQKKEEPKAESEEKRGRGQPTKFRPEFTPQLERLLLLEPTIAEIALFFNVDKQTIYNWQTEFPDFFVSMERGRLERDNKLLVSMNMKANGYTYEAEEIKVVSLGAGMGSEIQRVPVTKYVEPDMNAAQFLIKNYQGAKFRDKKFVDHTSGGEKIGNVDLDYTQLSEEMLEQIANASTNKDVTNEGTEG